MELFTDAVIPFPRDLVFVAYRDRLAETTQHLPNIRAIDVKSREEHDGEVKLVNEWTGGGDIPKVARAFLSPETLKWTDYATWKQATFEVLWRTEVHAFPNAVTSSGQNRFFIAGAADPRSRSADAGGGTRLEIRGDFTIDAAKIPGVPRILAKSVGPAIEKFFVNQIQLNSVAVAKAIGKLLASR